MLHNRVASASMQGRARDLGSGPELGSGRRRGLEFECEYVHVVSAALAVVPDVAADIDVDNDDDDGDVDIAGADVVAVALALAGFGVGVAHLKDTDPVDLAVGRVADMGGFQNLSQSLMTSGSFHYHRPRSCAYDHQSAKHHADFVRSRHVKAMTTGYCSL